MCYTQQLFFTIQNLYWGIVLLKLQTWRKRYCVGLWDGGRNKELAVGTGRLISQWSELCVCECACVVCSNAGRM